MNLATKRIMFFISQSARALWAWQSAVYAPGIMSRRGILVVTVSHVRLSIALRKHTPILEDAKLVKQDIFVMVVANLALLESIHWRKQRAAKIVTLAFTVL